jgi:TPR repeat protein
MRFGLCIAIAAALSCALGCATAALDESTRQLIVQAEQGDPNARHALCYRFSYGVRGAPKDYSAAKHWCELGAAAGIPSSQTLLAEMYFHGRGVSLDYHKAFSLYSAAAQQGHRHAQYMLGNMYVDGQGVPGDQALAKEWMRRAAASGHEEAQEWLQKREASR